uniref:Proline rich 22 n=1 Tax=Apteryx owenii TaxID=8824 RepID=A0A8B9Q1H1_APTOW
PLAGRMHHLPALVPHCTSLRPLGGEDAVGGAPASSTVLPEQTSLQPCTQPKPPLGDFPGGLQMAPCGCFFDPRIYHIEWTATNFPQSPVYKLSGSGGAAAPPGALLLDAQRYVHAAGQPDPFAPYQQLPGSPQYVAPYVPTEDGVGMAAAAFPGAPTLSGDGHAAPLLLALPALGLSELPLCGYSHIEGQLKPVANPAPGLLTAPAPADITGHHATATGQPLQPPVWSGSASPGLAGCSPVGQQPADLPEKVLLEDAMKLFDCSLAAELGQEEPSGLPRLGECPGADSFFLREEAAGDTGSLWLPEELLSSDYSVPEILNAILSMDYFYTVKAAPEEPGWDAGPEPRLPPDGAAQPDSRQERWQGMEGNGLLPKADGQLGSGYVATSTLCGGGLGEQD